MHSFEQKIVTVMDFPQKGIAFRDITPVLADAAAMRQAVDCLSACLEGVEFDCIAGLEARGFLFGMPMAYNAGCGFLPVRKQGKLPRQTAQETYALEYGHATIEMHKEDVTPGMRVVLVDDLLATGGTLEAAAKLLEKLGAKVVKIVTLIELTQLHGTERLKGYDVESVLRYDD